MCSLGHTLAKLGNLSSAGILNSKSKVWHLPGLSVVYFLPAVGVASSCVMLMRVVLSPQPSIQPAKLTDRCWTSIDFFESILIWPIVHQVRFQAKSRSRATADGYHELDHQDSSMHLDLSAQWRVLLNSTLRENRMVKKKSKRQMLYERYKKKIL